MPPSSWEEFDLGNALTNPWVEEDQAPALKYHYLPRVPRLGNEGWDIPSVSDATVSPTNSSNTPCHQCGRFQAAFITTGSTLGPLMTYEAQLGESMAKKEPNSPIQYPLSPPLSHSEFMPMESNSLASSSGSSTLLDTNVKPVTSFSSRLSQIDEEIAAAMKQWKCTTAEESPLVSRFETPNKPFREVPVATTYPPQCQFTPPAPISAKTKSLTERMASVLEQALPISKYSQRPLSYSGVLGTQRLPQATYAGKHSSWPEGINELYHSGYPMETGLPSPSISASSGSQLQVREFELQAFHKKLRVNTEPIPSGRAMTWASPPASRSNTPNPRPS
jgi:hypothetical protein